jgi:predicted phosphoadenosine phosphosulfate sulfurtransferase
MRVSNVHHETSVHSLFYLQEAEPETYEKLCQRIKGIDSAGKLGATDFFVKELPFMFADWIEYREFLLDKLIDNPSWKRRFRHLFDSQEKEYGHSHLATGMRKIHVNSILANDWEGIKAKNFRATVKALKVRRQNKGMETFG